MIKQALLIEMNAAHGKPEKKQTEILYPLFKSVFEIESGWYNGHYHKNDQEEWLRGSYPIPVISVKGVCDIKIQFDRMTVSAKLKKATALAYEFDRISEYEFEVFGVEDDLADFYHKGQTFLDLKTNILSSKEAEIGFSFAFSSESTGKTLFEFAVLLNQEGFYY